MTWPEALVAIFVMLFAVVGYVLIVAAVISFGIFLLGALAKRWDDD